MLRYFELFKVVDQKKFYLKFIFWYDNILNL